MNATTENHVGKYAVTATEFVKKVWKKFYIDDRNTGLNSVKEVVEQLKKRFSEAQFNVRTFRWNSKELGTYFETLENVNIVNNVNTVNEEVVDSKINNEQKILGILWDEIEDNLVFRLGDIFKDATNVCCSNKEKHFERYIDWDIYSRLLYSWRYCFKRFVSWT